MTTKAPLDRHDYMTAFLLGMLVMGLLATIAIATNAGRDYANGVRDALSGRTVDLRIDLPTGEVEWRIVKDIPEDKQVKLADSKPIK